MSSQLSAQAMTAQTAITRMSISRWSMLPWQRGSSTTPRCRTRLSMDMILSSPARGHVIIHQARASDRYFMREPWGSAIDSNKAVDKLLVTVFAAFAEFERNLMLEHQREGIARAKADGKYKGRAPTAQAKADQIKALSAEGLSMGEIAKRLGIGKGSVHRALTA